MPSDATGILVRLEALQVPSALAELVTSSRAGCRLREHLLGAEGPVPSAGTHQTARHRLRANRVID